MLLDIQNKSGLCKTCFNLRREGSAYCGKCNNEKRPEVHQEMQKKFPLLKEAKQVFPIEDSNLFTYGDTIYADFPIHYSLIAHETTHIIEQEKIGKDVWWEKYFKSKKFRLEQEVLAYRRQYKVAPELLNLFAEQLSSPLYGNLISLDKAIKLIEED